MKFPLSSPVLRNLLVAFVLTSAGSASAETLNWTGGTNGTGTAITTATNWQENTSPKSSSDLVIATTSNTTFPTLLLGSNVTINSMAFDNSAGKFSASNGLRIVTTTSTSNASARVLTFGNATTILTLTNNANVSFRSASLSSASTADPLPSLTLNLDYTGYGKVDIDASSILLVSDGSQNTSEAKITGTGGLEKTGAGVFRLSGIHDYAGGFILSDGTVRLLNSGTAGSGTITSTAFGTGTLTLKGGLIEATSTNGRTIYNDIVLDGTVGISPVANSSFTISTAGGGSTSLASDSTVTVGNQVTWNQTISGEHTFTKDGVGTLNLNGGNSQSGLTIADGTVNLGTNGTLGSSSVALITIGGTLNLNGTHQSVGALAGSGGTILNDGDAGSTLTVGNGDATSVYGGTLTDGSDTLSLYKTGSGTLSLTGSATHSGTTTVGGGTLELDGITLGAINSAGLLVQSGGRLDGSGVVSGPAFFDYGSRLAVNTYAGGTLTNAIGLLTFDQGLDLTGLLGAIPTIPGVDAIPLPFGRLDFDLGPGETSDLIVVNGTLTIGSGLLDIGDFNFTTASSFEAGTYTLFSSSQVINGTLGTDLTRDFGGGLFGTLALASGGTEIQLTLGGAPIPEPSTYAALFGLVAVGFAFYRRRLAAR